MPVSLSPEEANAARDSIQTAIVQLQNVQKQQPKPPDPESDDTLTAKIQELQNMLNKGLVPGLGGVTLIDPGKVEDLIDKMVKNTGDGGPISKILKKLVAIIVNIADLIASVIDGLVRGLVGVVEKHVGTGKITKKDPNRYLVAGSSDKVNLKFNNALVKHGFPAQIDLPGGQWNATLVANGTDKSGASVYLVESYQAMFGSISIGPVKLESVVQTQDIENPSTFSVSSDGQLAGTLYTRLKSMNWSVVEPLGIPVRTNVTGMVTQDSLSYEAQGYDFVFLAHLAPDLLTKVQGQVGQFKLPAAVSPEAVLAQDAAMGDDVVGALAILLKAIARAAAGSSTNAPAGNVPVQQPQALIDAVGVLGAKAGAAGAGNPPAPDLYNPSSMQLGVQPNP
jgi:hypothetical protein